ncbi:PREDICTED: zinc finger protein 691-like, partial [Gekko japonicus]|uniref:Zinc finger protein 691-like n=1 Tax=Gekko japonicus TaxID=146911 RepID=A0ABM1KLJ0_GEKJA
MEEKTYLCSYCGQTFQGTSTFMVHERTHIGERRYKCSQCGRTYPCHSDLLIHQKSHAGEKPHGRALGGGRRSCRSAPLPPHRGARLAEKFGSESGEEDEGPGVSTQEAPTQALPQQDPREQPENPDIKGEVGDVGTQ